MNYLELFSGIGGFRKAAESLNQDCKTNFHCVGFSEINRYALQTYEANYALNGEIRMNDIIEFTNSDENIAKIPDFELLLGGFPCQSFSTMGKKLGFEDERGSVLFSINRILEMKKPRFIVLENVKHLIKHDGGKTLEHILNFFKEHGYQFRETVVLDTQKFGLPQRRRRVFIICSLDHLELDLSENAIIENFNDVKQQSSLCQFQEVRDFLEKSVDQKYYLSEKIKHTILADGSKNFRSKSQIDLDIARTLTATMVKMHRASQDNYYSNDFIINGLSHKDTDKEILYKTPVRKLTPKEALLLQGFSTDFCQNALNKGVSEHQLYIQAGNALSVNTGYALLHYLFIKSKIQYKKIENTSYL
jgi:DNA (cytosine-5)-methyltransferase 1